jgi:hypothetical protein
LASTFAFYYSYKETKERKKPNISVVKFTIHLFLFLPFVRCQTHVFPKGKRRDEELLTLKERNQVEEMKSIEKVNKLNNETNQKSPRDSLTES